MSISFGSLGSVPPGFGVTVETGLTDLDLFEDQVGQFERHALLLPGKSFASPEISHKYLDPWGIKIQDTP